MAADRSTHPTWHAGVQFRKPSPHTYNHVGASSSANTVSGPGAGPAASALRPVTVGVPGATACSVVTDTRTAASKQQLTWDGGGSPVGVWGLGHWLLQQPPQINCSGALSVPIGTLCRHRLKAFKKEPGQ